MAAPTTFDQDYQPSFDSEEWTFDSIDWTFDSETRTFDSDQWTFDEDWPVSLPAGMSVAETLALHLEQGGVGMRGQSVFVNFMPVRASGILLLEPRLRIDQELVGYLKGVLQVVVRADSAQYTQGQLLANQVVSAFTTSELTLGSYKFLYVRPRHEPFAYPISDAGRLEFSINLEFACVNIDDTQD